LAEQGIEVLDVLTSFCNKNGTLQTAI